MQFDNGGGDLEPEYVFIVGLPRTGSKLVKIILSKASDALCRISGETWFFGDLFRSGIRRKISEFGDLGDDANVERLVEYFFSGEFKRSYWELVVRPGSGFNRSELHRRILQSNRSDRAIYVEIMCAFARRDPMWSAADRKVIGDKTPGHLYYVPTLLEWFPDAKIVHTFRDPRAILASEWKKIVENRESDSGSWSVASAMRSLLVVVYITVTWIYARRLHYRYSRLYPENYRLVKYEDLVANPGKEVADLCEFVGIEQNDSMLAPRHAGSSYAERRGKQGFDPGATERWREHLRPWIRIWLSIWLGRYLAEFGYKS